MNYITNILISILIILCLPDSGHAQENPPAIHGPLFTDTVAALQAQRIDTPTLLYWDTISALEAGLKSPPGRVGQPLFDNAILSKISFELSESKEVMDSLAATNSTLFYIELDAHGGSGRAGYLKVVTEEGQVIWVNIKGIGHTGKGNAAGRPAGPPLNEFLSHSDGGMSTIEGITETINARISNNNLKYGASRIIALVATGRTRNIKGSSEPVPLVIAVRMPLRRLDRGEVDSSAERIIETLSLANVRRIIKGDFVNQSNIGFDATLVDFGLMGVSTGYASATNQYRIRSMHEAEFEYSNTAQKNLAAFYIGKAFLNQMGIEEPKIDRLLAADSKSRERLINLGKTFRTLVDLNGKVQVDNFSPGEMKGKIDFAPFMSNFAADLILERGEPGTFIYRKITAFPRIKKGVLSYFNDKKRETKVAELVSSSAAILQDLIRVNRDEIKDSVSYAEAIRKVATYKNRDVEPLTKRALFDNATKITEGMSLRSSHVSDAIEAVMVDAQLGTGSFSTSQIIVQANTDATEIYIPAVSARLGHRPRLFTELNWAPFSNAYEFKINLTGDKGFVTFGSKLIETPRGPFYLIQIPHGLYPVTDKPVKIVPVDKIYNTHDELFYESAPLMLNERLGLEADLTVGKSLMSALYDQPPRLTTDQLKEIRDAQFCESALSAI